MNKMAQGFKAKTHMNESINLEDFKGQKIWLAFYRYASCPLCNLHINEIIKRFSEVENAGLRFFPVFQSSSDEVKRYAGKNELPFQIICDPKEEIYKLYNVGKSYRGFLGLSVFSKGFRAMMNGHLPGRMEGEIARLPSEFMINENFEIIYRYDGKNIGDHPSLGEILSRVEKN